MSDWEFIFDGIFGFLSSPIWLVPVTAFIEEQSVVFDESEENHLSWTDVHKRYSSLIESLLSSYLNDVGISDEEFLQACKTPSLQHNLSLKPVFQQLWAADDFEIFKKMMIQKNIELQLQAMELIRRRQGKKSSKNKSKSRKTDEEILTEVMKQTELEYKDLQEKKKGAEPLQEARYDETIEKEISESNEEIERLEHEVLMKQEETKQVVKESIANVEINTQEEPTPEAKKDTPESRDAGATEPPLVVDKYVPEKPLTDESDTKKTNTSSPKEVKKEAIPREPLKPLKKSPGVDLTSDWLRQAREENALIGESSHSQPTSIKQDEDTMSKREAYLRQQRDRMIQLKKKEREKQLNQYTSSHSRQRPTSARVAKQAMGGENESADKQPSEEERKRIEMRKALAQKLKKEVVNK